MDSTDLAHELRQLANRLDLGARRFETAMDAGVEVVTKLNELADQVERGGVTDEDPTRALDLALASASRDCENEGAMVELALRGGGKTILGRLTVASLASPYVVKVDLRDGGWATARRAEIAAVATRPARR